MSLCIALGSPSLATYSLSLTILNRYWARKQFNGLRSEVRRHRNVRQIYPVIDERINAIQFFLEQAQQVPLRISQEEGWLSSLIVSGRNHSWWLHLSTKLKVTQNGTSYALITSMIVATIAWLFTVIAAFVTDLGNISTALQLSAGSLWIWLVGQHPCI